MPAHPSPAKALPLLAAALLTACASVENAAPPVATFAAQSTGAKRAQLEQGRTIYVTKCAKCHVPEPVHRYSPSRWEGILAEMTEETKLGSAESAAVRAYVFAALGRM